MLPTDVLTCDLCGAEVASGFIFGAESLMREHMRQVHPAPDWSVTCPYCKESFDSHDSYGDSNVMLRDHIREAHV